MATPVKMPELGESITEGTITRWLKEEGDQVEADEPLFEVSTDKVDTEVPSPVAGVLKTIKVQADETVEVGAELAIIEQDGESGGEDKSDESDKSDRTPLRSRPRPRRAARRPAPRRSGSPRRPRPRVRPRPRSRATSPRRRSSPSPRRRRPGTAGRPR